MSIASELTALNGHILDAYDAVDAKGGTIPANKNMASLATAIGTISGGGGGDMTGWADVMHGTGTIVNDSLLTTTGKQAFRASPNVTSGHVFQKITSASFPNLTRIDEYCFYNWNALTTMNIPACTFIGSYAFSSCTALTTLTAPNVTHIGGTTTSESNGSNAFESCSLLTEIYMPNADLGWTTIFGYASYSEKIFKDCTSLAKIRIKPSKIGPNIFYGCSSLKALILMSESVPTLSNTNAFTSSGIASGTGYIYVRKSLEESYKTASNWSTYASQIRAIEDYSTDGTVNGDIVV